MDGPLDVVRFVLCQGATEGVAEEGPLDSEFLFAQGGGAPRPALFPIPWSVSKDLAQGGALDDPPLRYRIRKG